MACGPKLKITEEREVRLRELWYMHVTNEYIAKEMGISIVTLIKYGKRLGLEPRVNFRHAILRARWDEILHQRLHGLDSVLNKNLTISLPVDDMLKVRMQAEKRKTTPTNFCRQIIRLVMADDLVDAVLDDA